MDRFTADLRQIDQVDITKAFPLTPAAPRRTLSSLERVALKSALNFGKTFNPQAAVLLEPIDIGDKPPAVRILPPPSTPVGVSPGTTSQLTVALGVSASAFLLFGAVGGGGVFGSTTGDVGLFFTAGGGIFTNIGLGIGPELTIIFGTPDDFAGPYIGVSASVAVTVGSAVGGTLLFLPGPPAVFMGFAINYSIGPSFLPITMSVEVTNTAILPLIKF